MTKFWIKKRSLVSAPVIYYTIMRYRAHFLLQRTYRIKGILFSILSLSGPLSGEPDMVSQMMVLIKTVSKTNSPLFCLSVISYKKSFFCRYRTDFGSKLYLFPCKNYSFWRLLFSVFWFVKHHLFKPHVLHFQLNYECDVIFAVPQICAYFVDNPHNLEIYSVKITVSLTYIIIF